MSVFEIVMIILAASVSMLAIVFSICMLKDFFGR